MTKYIVIYMEIGGEYDYETHEIFECQPEELVDELREYGFTSEDLKDEDTHIYEVTREMHIVLPKGFMTVCGEQ